LATVINCLRIEFCNRLLVWTIKLLELGHPNAHMKQPEPIQNFDDSYFLSKVAVATRKFREFFSSFFYEFFLTIYCLPTYMVLRLFIGFNEQDFIKLSSIN